MAAQYAGDVNYLAGSIREAIQAEAIVAYSLAGVTRKLVTVARETVGAGTITFDKVNLGTNTISSADISARTDSTTAMTATVINTDKATITPALYPVMVNQYYKSAMSNSHDYSTTWGRLIANALAAKVDNLLNDLFDGFSNAVGTSTEGITTDVLLEGLAKLKSYMAPGQPAFVAPSGAIWSTYGLIPEIIGTNNYAGSVQDEALRSAFVNRVAGIDIYHSEEFTESGSATKSGIFVPAALGYGYIAQPDEFLIKPHDNVPILAMQWYGLFFGGVIELVNNYGVEVHTKTS